MIRVAASKEMTSNQGNSQYYLYAYRAGNTQGMFLMLSQWLIMIVLIMLIIGINLILMLQMMKNGSIQKIEYWFITRMIEKESPCLKENFSQISDLAEDILLKKDGFSVIELNPNQMSMFSAPANNIISNQDDLSNYDSINGEQPKSPLIKTLNQI